MSGGCGHGASGSTAASGATGTTTGSFASGATPSVAGYGYGGYAGSGNGGYANGGYPTGNYANGSNGNYPAGGFGAGNAAANGSGSCGGQSGSASQSGGSSDSSDVAPPELPSREWSDTTGAVAATGQYVGRVDGKVAIKDPSGRINLITASRLSGADQQYLAGVAGKGRSAAAAATLAKN